MLLGLTFSVFVLITLSTARPNAPKVNLELYYESLCPDCRQFILSQLYPTFEKVGEIVHLTLVPYGNADEKKHGDKWKFVCQHGKLECVGNLIETCAIHVLNNISASLQFVHCFESDIVHGGETGNPDLVAKKCAQELHIDMAAIKDCQEGPLGNELEHEMAEKTDALQPQHQYVPWITLNGKHTEKIQNKAENNLLKLLCETFTGPKPTECSGVQGDRCYRREFTAEGLKIY